MVLIMGLVEEVMIIILKINQHEMILHTQGKSQQVETPPWEE